MFVSARIRPNRILGLLLICPDPQLQEGIGIAVRKLGHVGRRERDAVDELTTPRVGRIGIVDREYDVVDTERQQRSEEWWLTEDATGRDPDLIEDGTTDGPSQVRDIERADLVDTLQHHGQHLAHVTDNEPQPRM